MIIFYSGEGGSRIPGKDFPQPELVLGVRKATIMLTYFSSHAKDRPESRFRRYRRLRKQAREKK